MSAVVQPPETWLGLFAFWRSPFRPGKLLLAGLVGGSVFVAMYFTAYLEFLVGPGYDQRVDPVTRQIQTTAFPCYFFEDKVTKPWAQFLKAILEPAHRLDRLCRPRVWSPPFSSYSPLQSGSSLFHL